MQRDDRGEKNEKFPEIQGYVSPQESGGSLRRGSKRPKRQRTARMGSGGCSVARLRRSCAHLNNAHNKVCNGEGGGGEGERVGLGWVGFPLVSRYESEEDGAAPGCSHVP